MRVLLVRPICPNERFGLGPFFRVEPLGLEYIAAALLARGHEVRVADLRFGHNLSWLLRSFRPRLVGIANMHTVDVGATLDVAREVKRYNATILTLVGGHSAAAYPSALFDSQVDAIAVEDGEATVPSVVEALDRGRPLSEVAGLWVRKSNGTVRPHFERTAAGQGLIDLDETPLPARELIAPYQRNYMVVHKMPLYAVETARGCPYRCGFCSIWRLMHRSFRARGTEAVCRDLASTGKNVFIVDDLFWHPRTRSRDLAEALNHRKIHKDWILVQSRLDTVARNPELLRVWRSFSREADIFFGFEAPTDGQLQQLSKDFDLKTVEEGVRVAREYKYGVTGNFVVDPDWEERDFETMWDVVDRLKLHRVGYTVLTPLPGTPLFDKMAHRIVERDWAKFDMHHILFEPRVGRRRFFELFAKSWRRNVLSPTFSVRSWINWMREVRISQLGILARTIYQTQRIVNVNAYLAEAFPLQTPAAAGVSQCVYGCDCHHADAAAGEG